MRGQNGTPVAPHIQQRRIDAGAMDISEDARVRDTVSALTFDMIHWKENYKEKIKDIIPKIDNLKNPLPDEKINKFIKLIMQDPELWKQIVSEKPSDFGFPDKELPKEEKPFNPVLPKEEKPFNLELPKGKTPVKFRDLMGDFLKKIEKLPPPNRD